MMKNEAVLEMLSIRFNYGCHTVLEEVSLTVLKGEALGITGPNGSGKSTLLKIVAGLLQPTEGSLRLFGQDSSDFKDRCRLGYVAQKASFINTGFPSTVEEVVLAGRVARCGLFRSFSREDRSIALESLARVGLVDQRHKPIGALSGGQQQRVFIARALAGLPELLLLDEPSTGMDAENQDRFYSLLRELVDDHGLTLLLVSHDREAITSVVDRKVCLDKRLCSRCDNLESTSSLSYGDCKNRLWTA